MKVPSKTFTKNHEIKSYINFDIRYNSRYNFFLEIGPLYYEQINEESEMGGCPVVREK